MAMNMLLVLILACLTIIGHGQQAQSPDAFVSDRRVNHRHPHYHATVRDTASQLNLLVTFLLAFNPLGAFTPGAPLPIRSAKERSKRLVSQPLLGPTVWSAGLLSKDDEFMNYGIYTDPVHPAAVDHPQPLMANMYCRLLDGTNITGKRVLEIGSGNGGGASVLYNHHKPAMYVGLDAPSHVAPSNARFSQFGASSLVFVDGDPCKIPFPDDSFDVVVSVESSHLYESFRSFLEEVKRVLVPNGRFLLEDFRESAKEMAVMQTQVEDVFGTALGVFDISSNVATSVEKNPEYIQKRIDLCAESTSREECEQYWASTNFPSYMFKIQLLE